MAKKNILLKSNIPNNIKNWQFNNIITKGVLEFNPPTQQFVVIEDNRKISPTTGKSLKQSDSKTIETNRELIQSIIAQAKARNIDPKIALSIGYQEGRLGLNDNNIGHNLLAPSQEWLNNEETGQYKNQIDKDASILIDGIKQKFDYANSLGKTNLVDSLQVYNGLGKLSPSTESKYYKGVQQNSFYGVPVTKDNPIDLSKNPLYGKTVKSIADSVIGTNLDIQSLIKNTKPFEMEKKKYGGKIKKLAGGGGMGAGAITGVVGNALDTVGNFIPVDNDGHGVSKKGQAISGGIQTGLDSAADIANSIPGGQIVGGALKIGSFLTKGITAIVDAVKEKKHPTDELVNEKYSPTYKDSSFSFGQMALGGNVATDSQKQFKQYDAPSHGNGGQFIDKNNNPTNNENKAVAEIEKKENSYKNYAYSHELGFAKMAAKINKKYDEREDSISKKSLDIELTDIMKKNEKVRLQIEQNQKMAQQILEFGGEIPKAKWGLPTDDGYFTQLMQKNGIMNFSNIGPVEDRSNLGPLNNDSGIGPPKPNFDFNKYTTSSSNFKLDDPPVLPNDGEGDLPVEIKDKKQFSPEAIGGYSIKGAEMVGHLAQILKKPDYVKPVYNPEENYIKGKMANRKFDSQSIIDAINLEENAGKENVANNSSSVAVQKANLQKLHANAISAISKTKAEEQQLNNQYRGEEANMLNTLGTQKMSVQVYAEDVNAKSKANVQNQRDKFLKESIGGLGDFLLKKDYVNKDNQFQENILKSKGINFTSTSYKNWNKAGINIVEFAGELESEADTAKREALKAENKKKYLAAGGSEAAWNAELTELENKYLKK